MIEELDDVMTDFFQRSVKQNPATGIPKTFDIQTEVAEVKGTSFKEEPRVVSQTLPQKNVSPPKPRIDTVVPTSGPTDGGTNVAITGDLFIPGCTVNYDGAPEDPGGTFTDSQHIHSITPAHSAGRVDVEVENVTGLSDELVNTFTFQQISVSPARGSYSGGSQVTITGTYFGFSSGYTVMFGPFGPVLATKINDTTLQCTVPAGPAHGFPGSNELTYDVKVIASDGGFGLAHNVYTYFLGAWNPVPSVVSTHPPGGFIIDLQSLDNHGVFDPTDYDLFQFVFSSHAASVNIGSFNAVPNPGQTHAGHAAVQIFASLANPAIDGILNLDILSLAGSPPAGPQFIWNVLH